MAGVRPETLSLMIQVSIHAPRQSHFPHGAAARPYELAG